MSGTFSGQAPDARAPGGRTSYVDAELLAPPEADPVQLSRNMFSQPAARPPPAPLTNMHLKKVARVEGGASGGSGSGAASAASGGGGVGAGGVPRRTRPPRSVAASSVRGGRAAFSVVSDEEVIDVDGEPTTLADDDLDLPPPSPGDPYDNGDGHAGGRANGDLLGQSGIAGLGPGGGGPDPLEELEADTPAVRLAEANADLEAEIESNKDPWVMVPLAQMALAQAKVVWRTMPVAVREEPLLLAKAHFALARAYQALGGCDRQASDHGKQALAAIPRDVADTEGARALRAEVQVMRAEALLSSTGVPGLPPDAACNQARKALALLVKAGGLTEPVAWTQEEIDENDLPGAIQRSTIDKVTDMGIVALMGQCHGVVAEARLRSADAEEAERRSSLRSSTEAASRLDRKTERGDAFYSPEQMDKYRAQEEHFLDEADAHAAESLRLAAEAERAFDAAMYCLNAVIDREGNRLENDLGREGKLTHPTFQALWRRSLDFMAGIANAYALQRKDAMRLAILEEILTAFVQYGSGRWMPAARHIQALKDKGSLLVDKREYEGAMSCYETLTEVVSELFAEDVVRKELQVAESLKLRGDVALAAGDFRTAQHMFNQALELYQRHLGAQAPVAVDLLHRIDEVKSYLAETRVMGRLASFPGRASQTVAASVLAHSVSGSGPGSATTTTPKSGSLTSRPGGPPRPHPPLPLSGGPGSSRLSSGLATPVNPPDTPGGTSARGSVYGGGGGGSARQSVDGLYGTAGGGGMSADLGGILNSPAALSAASGLQGPRLSTSSSLGGGGGGGGSTLPALPGSRRPSYGSGTAAVGRTSVGGSVREAAAAADGGGGDDAAVAAAHVAASVASYRSGGSAWGGAASAVAGSTISRRSVGGDEAAVEGGADTPRSLLSHRSGDGGGGGVSGGNWMSGGGGGGGQAALSHHSGEGLGGSPSATSLSQQRSRMSGLGAAGGFGAASGGGGDDGGGGGGGAWTPGAASHHSSRRLSSASGFAAGGFATGGGGGGGAAAGVSGDIGGISGGGGGGGGMDGNNWLAGGGGGAAASHHSGEGLGGSPSAASLSRRSNASGFGAGGGAAAAALSHHSGEGLGGSPSVTSLSQQRSRMSGLGAGGGGDDDAAGIYGGGGGGAFGTASPKVPASHHSGEPLGGSPSAASLSRRLSNTSGLGGFGAATAGAADGAVDDALGSRRTSGADHGWGLGAAAAAASPAASGAASRRVTGDLYGNGGGGGGGSQAGSVAASRRFSGDLLGAFNADGAAGSPSGGSVKSAAQRGGGGGGGGSVYGGSVYGALGGGGNSGDFGSGGGAEPARPGSPSAMSAKSAASRSAGGLNFGGSGGGGGGGLGGGNSGEWGNSGGGGGGGGFEATLRPSPSPYAASNKSLSRAASGLGGAGGGNSNNNSGEFGGGRLAPDSPSAASVARSAARGTSGFGLEAEYSGGGAPAAPRPDSPSAFSAKSTASRGAAGEGGSGGGFAFGGGGGADAQPARPASPSAASNRSFSRGPGGTSGELGGAARGDSFSQRRW